MRGEGRTEGDVARVASSGRSHTQFPARWSMVRAMFRHVVAATVIFAACSQTDNDRPRTLQYVTEAILQPNCAQDVCHSSYTRAKGYAFDTVAAARQSLKPIVNTEEPEASLLY